MNIGEHVAYLRKHKEWSLRDLSARSGIAISALSSIEHGGRATGYNTIERLSAAFEMSVPVFLGGADLDLSADEQALLEAYRAGDVVGVLKLIVKNK